MNITDSMDVTENGVPYVETGLRRDGADFMLYPLPGQGSLIHGAKKWLKNSFDVLSISMAGEDDKNEYYKGLIFKNKAQKHLKWYEIFDDEKIIQKERKAGTSIEKFIEVHVLPNVEKVKAKNFERFGEGMYKI